MAFHICVICKWTPLNMSIENNVIHINFVFNFFCSLSEKNAQKLIYKQLAFVQRYENKVDFNFMMVFVVNCLVVTDRRKCLDGVPKTFRFFVSNQNPPFDSDQDKLAFLNGMGVD